jgi:hypothetical protein
MATVPLAEWWIRRLCRYIDLTRREARRQPGTRLPFVTDKAHIRARYNQLQATKPRDLLTLNHRRRRAD